MPEAPRVAVVGAGVAGLVSAKILKHDGFDVTIFEQEPTLGGVWAASRSYPWLRTNNPRETYAYSDFPYPDTTDEFPAADQVRGYLESYAEHYGLAAHLRLSTKVKLVTRAPGGNKGAHPGFRVIVEPAGRTGDRETTGHFDFVVVCNGVFSSAYVPHFDGRRLFTGRVVHSSEVRESASIRGQRVVVVGAGKSALDCAAFAGHEAAACTLVFRSPHWMLPRYFGPARVDRVLFTRLSELLLPAYHSPSPAEVKLRNALTPLSPLWRLWWKAMGRWVRHLNGIPVETVPDRPIQDGIENVGIGGEFYAALRNGLVRVRRARIAAFSGPDAVRLDTGEQVEADAVICATGWRQDAAFLAPDLAQAIFRDGQVRLYRHIVPPRETRLGFVGYASSSASPLVSEISAHWLSQCFRGELALPAAADMERETDRVLRWTARVFPARKEGYFIGAYITHYVDELLRDMGLCTRRKNNILAEYLAPFWPERYRHLALERRRAGDGG